MEPLKPSEKKAVLENRPNAQPGDLEEYERLLSRRFTADPDFGPAAAPARFAAAQVRPANSEQRIAELYQKLFVDAAEPAESAQ